MGWASKPLNHASSVGKGISDRSWGLEDRLLEGEEGAVWPLAAGAGGSAFLSLSRRSNPRMGGGFL